MEENRLRQLRGNRTQDYIAKAVNLQRATYRNYETGQRQADYETLAKLADYFNVSIDYILGRTDDPGRKISDIRNTVITFDSKGTRSEFNLTNEQAAAVNTMLDAFTAKKNR